MKDFLMTDLAFVSMNGVFVGANSAIPGVLLELFWHDFFALFLHAESDSFLKARHSFGNLTHTPL